MEDKLTVIFLDYFEALEKVVPIIQRVCANLKSRPIIVSSNLDIYPLSVCANLKVIYFDELLSKQDYEFMEHYVFSLTQTWHSELSPMEGATGYKEVQFSSLVEFRAQGFFSAAIKNLEIILKIVGRFHPDKIILMGRDDVFQDLSVFIKEKLNIPTLFIKTGEKSCSFNDIIKKFWRCTVEVITDICDNLIRIVMARKKRNNGIFVDTRLYFELKDLIKEYHPYLYLIEKGLRIRSRLIKEERLLFAPLSVDTSFKISYPFSAFYRYWKFLRKDVKFQNIFVYRSLPIWRILEKSIRELIIYDFFQAKKNIVFLEKLYKNLKPKIVILRCVERPPERAIVLAAKQVDIPTLVVQHGVIAGRVVHSEVYPDNMALWGKAAMDRYSPCGNGKIKCVVTGKSQHDKLFADKGDYEKEGKKILLEIGADPSKATILYIAHLFKNVKRHYAVDYYQDSQFFVGLDSILNVAKSFPNKQLIIKVHPFDLIDMKSLYNNSKIKEYANVFIVKNVDIIPLIKISSLVIVSRFSSATIDAVILNKPVITLNFYKKEDLVPFAQRGVALSVTKPEHLSLAVRQIFEDGKLKDWFASNRDSFVYDYAYKIDGKSSQRVKDLIRELAQNKSEA